MPSEKLKELETERELILLRREEKVIARLEQQDREFQAFEDTWASSDPYTSRLRPGIGTTPNDLFQHSFGFHTARPGSRRHGSYPPFYRTEMEHWQIVDAARLLEGLCSTASNVLDILTQFAIFTGFEYKVVPKGAAADSLVSKAQELVDKFILINDWYFWECEIFRRSRRDGECFLYLEPDEVSGLLFLRAIEPEQVKEPQDTSRIKQRLGVDSSMSWKYGILTPKDDTSRPEGYWVVSNYSDAKNLGEFIPPEEMVHVKTEWVDRCAKRGVSDFFSIANDCHSTRKLLRNLRESSTVQAAIAWVREHPEATDPTRQGNVIDATNVTQSGEVVPAARYDGPVMLDVSHGMKYTPGPLGTGPNSLIEVLQAALRAIGARWQMPEALISGDASNANLASALVAEAPFVRALEARQWYYSLVYQNLMQRVLTYAAATGQLGVAMDTVLDRIEVSVEAPPVMPRKLREETERNAILHGNRILSRQSWSAREDLDPEEEKSLMEEDPPTPAGQTLPGDEDREDRDETKRISPEPEGERIT